MQGARQQRFTFGGHTLVVHCRRPPEEVQAVTQTLQLDVEELFSSLLTWGSDAEEAAPPPHASSKRVCGNVADDQPDLIGFDVWPAAIALGGYLAVHPRLVAGARVMELGAGMGLPGLLAARLGASRVALTDYEPVVVEQLARNAELNALQAQCTALVLDWFDLSGLPAAHRCAADLLLLADVIYAAAVVEGLVTTLRAVLAPQGMALVAHRIRRPLVFNRREKVAQLQENDEIFEDFKRQCIAAGFSLRELTPSSSSSSSGGSSSGGEEDVYASGKEPLLLAVALDPERLAQLPAAGQQERGSEQGDAARGGDNAQPSSGAEQTGPGEGGVAGGVPAVEGLAQRSFTFGAHELTVACRQPPEDKGCITLTWQLPDSNGSKQHGGGISGMDAAQGPAPDLIGFDVWPAALALCDFLKAHPELVQGRRAVELGAGMGLVGLLAAKLGASSMALTDYEPLVVEQLARNAELNGVADRCVCLALDWHRPGAQPVLAPQAYSLVLAADVLYASIVAQPLAATLAALLHPEGVCILGHQVRRAIVLDRQTRLPRLEEADEPLERFRAACAAAGLRVRELGSRETSSAPDAGNPMLLLAVGWDGARLDALPAPV